MAKATRRRTPSGSDAGRGEVIVRPHPDRITAGGLVTLAIEVDSAAGDGPFEVEWTVLGPGQSAHPQIVVLGRTGIDGTAGRLVRLENNEFHATLDTSSLAVGAWRVKIRLTPVVEEVVVEEATEEGTDEEVVWETDDSEVYEGISESITVLPRPLAAGDDLAVTLTRTAVPPTADQALWVAIRRSSDALGFDQFDRFMRQYVCGEEFVPESGGHLRKKLRRAEQRTALPFPHVDQYRVLKAATEVFLMCHCGTRPGDLDDLDLDEESRRLNRQVHPGELEEQFRDYLVRIPTANGDPIDVLPYLGLIRLKLRDVPVLGMDRSEDAAAEVCQGILAEKLADPCFLELIWSYWHEEGLLQRTINAISWRFQNRRSGPGRDALAGLDIDPLRPLNNLLWGWIRDEQHRLTTTQRAYEYDHEYGLVLGTKPGRPARGADSRSRFIEAFHNLLALCEDFYRSDDDATVIADGFSVLNALKETHLLLTESAHNQYGDLPWTARQEMLMVQWILARPEMREFLPTRTMVAYPEPWMDRVDAMNRMQGWSDTSVVHFRDLAVFGEQLLLGIRFGNWSTVIDPEQASNWARYCRAEVKGYVYAFGAVTGTDLSRRGDVPMAPFQQRRRAGYMR